MSPIDPTLWNGMENYSPHTRNWLDTHVPLYRLDLIMGMDPLTNSLKDYDPTNCPAPHISKKCEEIKETARSVGSVVPDAIKKKIKI